MQIISRGSLLKLATSRNHLHSWNRPAGEVRARSIAGEMVARPASERCESRKRRDKAIARLMATTTKPVAAVGAGKKRKLVKMRFAAGARRRDSSKAHNARPSR
ncbi:hypothetical protein BS78_08G014700 [Paspalum vaginatum]|nr:hypothetical protein BS78_08G014700 [Paspalum vaginatum]